MRMCQTAWRYGKLRDAQVSQNILSLIQQAIAMAHITPQRVPRRNTREFVDLKLAKSQLRLSPKINLNRSVLFQEIFFWFTA
jgi:hypothetical protein